MISKLIRSLIRSLIHVLLENQLFIYIEALLKAVKLYKSLYWFDDIVVKIIYNWYKQNVHNQNYTVYKI